jgi:transcriptional regulator with XRE-family HTH domain
VTILYADRRPLVDRVLADGSATGFVDGARSAGGFDDLGNSSHANIDTEFNSVFQAGNALPRNYFQDYAGGMDWKQRLNETFAETGWSKAELGRRSGVSYDNVIKYLAGAVDQPRGDTLSKLATALGVDPLWLEKGIDPDVDETEVPVMGYVGAGGEVDPDFEQVPPEGMRQVTIPMRLPKEMVAFEVTGSSMMPQFRAGTTIVVYKEQRRSTESFFGEEAIVRTADGRRFIKTIMRGENGVTLNSWNAEPIENVSLVWIGEIFTIMPPGAAQRVARQGGIQGQLGLKTA